MIHENKRAILCWDGSWLAGFWPLALHLRGVPRHPNTCDPLLNDEKKAAYDDDNKSQGVEQCHVFHSIYYG